MGGVADDRVHDVAAICGRLRAAVFGMANGMVPKTRLDIGVCAVAPHVGDDGDAPAVDTALQSVLGARIQTRARSAARRMFTAPSACASDILSSRSSVQLVREVRSACHGLSTASESMSRCGNFDMLRCAVVSDELGTFEDSTLPAPLRPDPASVRRKMAVHDAYDALAAGGAAAHGQLAARLARSSGRSPRAADVPVGTAAAVDRDSRPGDAVVNRLFCRAADHFLHPVSTLTPRCDRVETLLLALELIGEEDCRAENPDGGVVEVWAMLLEHMATAARTALGGEDAVLGTALDMLFGAKYARYARVFCDMWAATALSERNVCLLRYHCESHRTLLDAAVKKLLGDYSETGDPLAWLAHMRADKLALQMCSTVLARSDDVHEACDNRTVFSKEDLVRICRDDYALFVVIFLFWKLNITNRQRGAEISSRDERSLEISKPSL